MSRQSKGRNIVNLLNLGDQQIASIINVSSFDDEGGEEGKGHQLVMATRKGVVKKTRLSAYSNPRATGVIAINLDPNDDLIGVSMTTGKDHIILGTRDGMTIRFNEGAVRSMGRASRGVRGIKLRTGDAVVGMVIAQEKAALFTVCENGYGKRTGIENYRPQGRGGVGLKNIKTTTRNGKVVALESVQSGDDLLLMTAQGMVIRTGLGEIRAIGRNTQGVRLIKLKPGDKLVAVEKVVAEEKEEPRGANGKDKAKTQPPEPDDEVDIESEELEEEVEDEPESKPKAKKKREKNGKKRKGK
jgi:DNA gyrase subunit A